jgi:putative transposase
LRFLKKARRHHGPTEKFITDGLRSYPAAIQDLDATKVRVRPCLIHNHLAQERHLVDRQTYKARRSAALAEWQSIVG